VNFTTLSYFLAAAEDLNITHAANRLHISQQALSEHIVKIEHELGVRVFNRTPVLSLTYAGRQLMDYAVKALSVEHQIFQMAGDINNDQRGELRIGISHTCGRAILPSILPAFRRTHPMVDLILDESTSSEMEASLKRGDLDLMIDFSPIDIGNLQYEVLTEERLFLVVPKKLLIANYGACYSAVCSECSRSLDLKLFSRFPFILIRRGNRVRSLLEQYMKSISFTPNIILETENVETALALAQKGMGITTYSELFRWCIPSTAEADDEVEYFPFRAAETTGTLIIAWISEHYQSKAAAEFIEACRQALAFIHEYSVPGSISRALFPEPLK
jgi:DNA-binding transcriptional LysR family regulator